MYPFPSKVLGVNAGQLVEALSFGIASAAIVSGGAITVSSSKRTECCRLGLLPGVFKALLIADLGQRGRAALPKVATALSTSKGVCGHRGIREVDFGVTSNDDTGVIDVVAAKVNSIPTESEASSKQSGSLRQNCFEADPSLDSSKQVDFIMHFNDWTAGSSELLGVLGVESWFEFSLSVVLSSMLLSSVRPQISPT